MSRERFAAAWVEYRKRRRHYWQSFFSFFLLAVPIGLVAVIFQVARLDPHSAAAAVFSIFSLCCAAAWLVTCWAMLYRLLTWPCPRCGKPFAYSWLNSWPTNKCKHCGLLVDEV
jgi:hypothetical protein